MSNAVEGRQNWKVRRWSDDHPVHAPGDLFPGLALEGGYVAVDRAMATNLPGVFAAGDCTGGPLQISKAIGEGQVAGQKAAAFAAAGAAEGRGGAG